MHTAGTTPLVHPANPANFQFKNKRRSEPGTQLAANPHLICSSLTKE
jgi:hypothetical protein